MENKVKDIEIYKLEDLNEIKSFKTKLVEIKYENEVQVEMSYFPTLKLIGIKDYIDGSIFKKRCFNKYECGTIFLTDKNLNIPYNIYSKGEDEAFFIKLVCEVFREYFSFIRENKEEIFKDRLILENMSEEMIENFLDYFLYPFSTDPFGSRRNGVLSDIMEKLENSEKDSTYSFYYRIRNYYIPLIFTIDNVKYEIDIRTIDDEKHLMIHQGRDSKLKMCIPYKEWTNYEKISRLHPLGNFFGILAYYYYYRDLFDKGLFEIIDNLICMLQTQSFNVHKEYNGIYLRELDKEYGISILPMKYNNELYYKIRVDTGIYPDFEDSEMIYEDIFKKEEAIQYFHDVIKLRVNGFIADNYMDKVKIFFDFIEKNYEPTNLLDYVESTIIASYKKDNEGNTIYTLYSFFDKDKIIASHYTFKELDLCDLLLREEDSIWASVRQEEIDLEDLKDTLLYDIHKKYNKGE